jgi:hypothetical protein
LGATTGTAGDSNPIIINIGQGLQEIERTDTAPGL